MQYLISLNCAAANICHNKFGILALNIIIIIKIGLVPGTLKLLLQRTPVCLPVCISSNGL